jgi:hypothetical protein
MAGGFINDGMQVEKYVYDFAVDAGATGEIFLSSKANKDPIPNGSLILDMCLHVETAFTSGGSATLDVGNDDDPNGYLEAIAVAALGANTVHRAGSVAGQLIWDDTNDHAIGVYVADADDGEVSVTIATAAMTAGKAGIYMLYVRGLSA